MTKADIVERIAAATGLTKLETDAVVNGFITTIIEAMKAGEHIEIRGFGTFKVVHRAARPGRDIQNNRMVQIPARHRPVFKASSRFEEVVDEAHR